MASEADLSKIVTVISLLDGYRGHDFKDPAKIDEAVKIADLKPLSRGWKSIREDVEKIYFQQEHLLNTLRRLRIISDSIIFSYFAINVLAMMFNIQTLKPLITNPLLLIIILAIIIVLPFFRHKTMKKIKEKREMYAKKLQKIRGVIQDLIFYLCEKVRLGTKDPWKHKIKVKNLDYKGITVVRKLGFFGPENYTVVPSVISAIVSKAKNYIKVVDPWATERETLQALFKVHPKVKTNWLIPDKIGEDKRFKNRIARAHEKIMARNISILSCDLNDLNNGIIITKERAWRATKKGWHTLVEVKDRKKKRALEKVFDKKWGYASPIF